MSTRVTVRFSVDLPKSGGIDIGGSTDCMFGTKVAFTSEVIKLKHTSAMDSAKIHQRRRRYLDFPTSIIKYCQ